MLERALIAVAVVALFAVAVALGRRWYAWRNARIEARVRAEGSTTATGTPRIVYFTTATCVICKVQQEPAMSAVAARVPDLLIQRHDAVEEGELAKQYGVLSVPTTAVYRRDGTLVTINRGFTPAAALLAQIEDRTPDIDGGHEMASEAVA